MPYAVIFRSSAKRALAKLPRDVQQRIMRSVELLPGNPRPAGCKKLQGNPDLYRIRVGDFRVIYKIDDGILRVLVVEVGHRGSVYD